MTKIKLVIDQSAPLFIKWFDREMDHWVKLDYHHYSHLRDAYADPFGTFIYPLPDPHEPRLLAQDDTVFWLEYVPPCSYLDYRLQRSDYASRAAYFSQHLPLEMMLVSYYVRLLGEPVQPRGLLTEPDAVAITLESLPLSAQVRLVIDYRMSVTDPLLRFLYALTSEYEEVKDQLDPDCIDTLLLTASPHARFWLDPLGRLPFDEYAAGFPTSDETQERAKDQLDLCDPNAILGLASEDIRLAIASEDIPFGWCPLGRLASGPQYAVDFPVSCDAEEEVELDPDSMAFLAAAQEELRAALASEGARNVGDPPERLPSAPEDDAVSSTSEPLIAESSVSEARQRPGWFPKKEKTLDKWRESYAVIKDRRKLYSQEYEDGTTDEPNPHIDDLQDALAAESMWKKKPSESTVSRIMKAGDEGWF